MELSKRNNSTFSIALFDIDHFKKFNDTYGHRHGDKVLTEVAQFVKNNIREDDTVFRYGGEEFLIHFNKTNNKEIISRLERIRSGIEKLKIQNDKGEVTPVTASFGLAEYPTHGETPDELIENADKALYKAKNDGRNRIVTYTNNID